MPVSKSTAFLKLQKDIQRSLPGLVDIETNKKISSAFFSRTPDRAKALIGLPKNSKFALAELAHEGVHAKRFFYDTPDRKVRELLAKSSLYNMNRVHKLQALGIPLAFILAYPSYAIPVLQAAVVAPIIAEEVVANREGLKKLRQLGVSDKEIARTKRFYIKNFSTYPARLLLIPLLTAAYIKYKKSKEKAKKIS